MSLSAKIGLLGPYNADFYNRFYPIFLKNEINHCIGLEERYCLLLDCSKKAVGYTADTESEKFLIEPVLAQKA